MSDYERTIKQLEAQRDAAQEAEHQRQINERRMQEQSPAAQVERLNHHIAVIKMQEADYQFEQRIDAALDIHAQIDVLAVRLVEKLSEADRVMQEVHAIAAELDRNQDIYIETSTRLLNERYGPALEARLGAPVSSADVALQWLGSLPAQEQTRRRWRIGIIFALTGQLQSVSSWNALEQATKRLRAVRVRMFGGSYL